MLGIPPEQFIWLRNAGNIITGPLSSTMRSIALACAVKGGKEIVILGHTDCQISKTTSMNLLDRFKALGIERHLLPENINELLWRRRERTAKCHQSVRHCPIQPARRSQNPRSGNAD